MNDTVKQYLREIGAKGGKSTSQAKRDAAKRNGFKPRTKPLGVVKSSPQLPASRDYLSAYV